MIPDIESQSRLSELKIICSRAAEEILRCRDVLVASHVDADGLTSAGIICTALYRCSIDYSPMFFRQLDASALEKIADLGKELVIFTDLGSGMLDELGRAGLRAVVVDHHRPMGEFKPLAHINPHLVGADGATQLSGSGTSFLLASALGENDDLSAQAIVGAVGDLQDLTKGQLVGINRLVLDVGERAGAISCARDLKLFGRQTRPVFKVLEYSQDPYLQGLSGNEDACIAFLKELGIRQGGERWRRWIDLTQEEKSRVVSGLVRRGLRTGVSSVKLERLVGEVYTLLLENEGTELRDASEYSTLLNATARYGHSEVGLKVCMGDRDMALDQARKLLGEHRQNLVNGIKLIGERGITALNHIQYFDAGDAILDTIVGIVAGMCFQMADRSKPIIALAKADSGVKVSARGTSDLVRSGLDLSAALSQSARAVGGVGGGHNIAAGAIIPGDKRDDFLGMLDEAVGLQLKA
jgi:single-stranded-DNA-specific exonuclease